MNNEFTILNIYCEEYKENDLVNKIVFRKYILVDILRETHDMSMIRLSTACLEKEYE